MAAAQSLANIGPGSQIDAAPFCQSVGVLALAGIANGQVSYGGISGGAIGPDGRALPYLFGGTVPGPNPHIYLYNSAFESSLTLTITIAHEGYHAYVGSENETFSDVSIAGLGASMFATVCTALAATASQK
jgi:hypothetical protein